MLKTNQAIRTGAVTSVLAALVLFVYACEAGTNSSIVAPNTADARGGKPGKPGGASPILTEYWIYQNDVGNVIHIAGTGDVDRVNPRVSLDHFFNGERDDDFSDHFWPAPVFSTRGYESVSTASPSSGESRASPATRGSRTGSASEVANSAGVR